MNKSKESRRVFIKQAVLASATAAIVPSLFATSNTPLSQDKVKLALIGVGNRGGQIAKDCMLQVYVK